MDKETAIRRLEYELDMMEQRKQDYEEKQEASRNNVEEYFLWRDRIDALRQEIHNKREFLYDLKFDD